MLYNVYRLLWTSLVYFSSGRALQIRAVMRVHIYVRRKWQEDVAQLHTVSFQFERLILRIQKTVLRREVLRYRSDETTYFLLCLARHTIPLYDTRSGSYRISISFSGFKHIILHAIDPRCIRCCTSDFCEKITATAISTIITRSYGDIPFLTIRYSILDALYFNVILYSLIVWFSCNIYRYKYCMGSNEKFSHRCINFVMTSNVNLSYELLSKFSRR